MNFRELAEKRQSCRNFSDKLVDIEVIKQCVDIACFAPSACNSQPWEFIIIQNEEVLEEVRSKCFTGIYNQFKFVKQAPMIVALVMKPVKSFSVLGGLIRKVKFNWLDIGIVGDHFDLALNEAGLGSCWVGWFNEKPFKKILSLNSFDRIPAIFAVGYPHFDVKQRDKIRKESNTILKII